MLDYQGFLARLKETPRDWFVTATGEIRRRNPDKAKYLFECPVCSLSQKFLLHSTAAAIEIGLPYEVARDIQHAADKFVDYDEQIRADILVACGIQEAV